MNVHIPAEQPVGFAAFDTGADDLFATFPTQSRIDAAAAQGIESATRFAKSHRTGAIYADFYGRWLFVADEKREKSMPVAKAA